ncbi:MAG TPA: patatin-like phospholipase family protein [Caulobacteraceae bacterium]|jgi:NTE family protein|nr:patatin-like phospholipase family protein [Caulobacteraceae bacterium]
MTAKPISLALQGGGAHGAFQWGVIDRLLEDGRVEIRAVTGASGGAMNGVVLAAGLLAGGPAGGREKLDAFWRAVNTAGGRNAFGDVSVWNAFFNPDWLKTSPGWQMAQGFATGFSPYQFNPLNLNPLRAALNQVVDFAAIRTRSPIALYVSATAVRTSKSHVFRTRELTTDHILASACLPQLFQAVEIDGEPYWDGGYLANPPLWPLFYDATPPDILIVNLNPFVRKATPRTPGEIIDRLNEITFNAPLVSELRAVAFVQKLIDDGLLKEKVRGRYRNMLIHAIEADRWLQDLSMDSKFDTEWNFLTELKARGRRAADAWLAKGLADVGVKSSIDVTVDFL